MVAAAYNLSPQSIAAPGTPGGPGFALSSTDWITIQVYVNDALALPTTDAQFRNFLGSGAPADLSDFSQLIAAYGAINASAMTWQQTTYPNSVSLASTIYQYGTNLAPTYYNAIQAEANALIANPADQQAADALKAILAVLKKYADDAQAKATAVFTQILAFKNSMAASQITLIGTDGKTGLKKYYNDKYGDASALQASLNTEIQQARDNLASDQAEYKQDCIVAGTSPAYAWVWPAGTIAAAIVAGIYGHRAVEALDRIRDDNDKISELSAELAADANLINALNLSNSSITGIVTALDNALPVVELIAGVWGGISGDLGAIATLIDTNIGEVPPIIMNLGIAAAIKAWSNVAQAANAYRVNAYITTTPGSATGAVTSMLNWRVKNLIASPATRAHYA